MSFLSRKTSVIALAVAFSAVAAGGVVYEHQANANTGTTYNLCFDNILIPETVEQADYLKHHAAEAYAAADQKQDPKDSPLLAPSLADFAKEGKTAKVIGFDPKGATSTLPDGTTRPIGCYIVSVK